MIAPWPLWRRFAFRFFFIYLLLFIAPWSWLGYIPGVDSVLEYYFNAQEWLALKLNDWLFHVPRPAVPVQNNGSGDTSRSWAVLFTTIFVAFVGAVIWSLLQRQRKEYTVLNYWLCLITRYHIILVSFGYGIIKLFCLQMQFPNYSLMATPLGDYLPMRLSWVFIGSSAPYQFFSGLMEVVSALLLLFRRTATLGAMVAAGVYLNVAVLNLSYDIPVKIFSMQMFVCCLFLLANELNRILCFFLYNRPAAAGELYHFPLQKRWMRIGRMVLKTVFILYAVGTMLMGAMDRRKGMMASMNNMPFKAGVYEVTQYAVNRNTFQVSPSDSLRWQNFAFDDNEGGSIGATDTSFRMRYHRAYFAYKADTAKHTIDLYKMSSDSIAIANLTYQILDSNTIAFQGKRQNDSLFFVLKRSPRNFQLAERQFHWISEANR